MNGRDRDVHDALLCDELDGSLDLSLFVSSCPCYVARVGMVVQALARTSGMVFGGRADCGAAQTVV